MRKIVNAFILVAVILSWLVMALFGKGTLAENGFGNLKYFTVLSNLLEGAASLVWLIRSPAGGEERKKAEIVKYVAAASVGLTFVVVMGFLGPLYGYASMFTGATSNQFMMLPEYYGYMAVVIYLA